MAEGCSGNFRGSGSVIDRGYGRAFVGRGGHWFPQRENVELPIRGAQQTQFRSNDANGGDRDLAVRIKPNTSIPASSSATLSRLPPETQDRP